MEARRLTGGARIAAAPAHIRAARAIVRLGRGRALAAGAQSLSQRGAQMTIGAEAIVLSPYWDTHQPPVLTIYVGHTAAAGAPNPANCWNQLGTIPQAISVFEADAPKYVAGVRRAFTRPLSQAQFDAAFDFNYNTGSIEIAQWVSLWNAGHDLAAEQSYLANWRSPAGRRELDRMLFFHNAYGGDGTAVVVPANARGLLNWAGAKSVDISGMFSARAA